MWGPLAVRAAATVVLAITAAGSAGAQPVTEAPALKVCVVLSPQLLRDAHSAATAMAESRIIWTPLGVALDHVDQPDETCQRVIVVKADHEARPEDSSRETALGWVPFVAGRARQLVFLRVARARLMIDGMSPAVVRKD